MKISGYNGLSEEDCIPGANVAGSISEKRWLSKSLEMKEACFLDKIQREKTNSKFEEYMHYLVYELRKEEMSLFTSTFYMILFLLMFIIGVQHRFGYVENCPVPEYLLAICLIQSGILGSVIQVVNLAFHIFGARNKYVDNCKIVFRFVLFLNNLMGLTHLYCEQSPVADDNPCFFYMYWFSTFMLLSTSFPEILYMVLLVVSAIFYIV